jgi:acyl transferase domain-containing protein
VDDFYDPSRMKHNALLARHGCFIKRPGDFDHSLFNISPREAMQMDPVQRMLLMTTYEALEMAGYSNSNEEQTPARIATYFGQTQMTGSQLMSNKESTPTSCRASTEASPLAVCAITSNGPPASIASTQVTLRVLPASA